LGFAAKFAEFEKGYVSPQQADFSNPETPGIIVYAQIRWIIGACWA
jgi:hypothetical protein